MNLKKNTNIVDEYDIKRSSLQRKKIDAADYGRCGEISIASAVM